MRTPKNAVNPADLPPSWPPEYPLHVPISTELARSMDQRAGADFGLPSLVLMEHASRGIAALAARLAPAGQPVVVLCGPGNNGGDGYGAARFLASCGRDVRTWRLAPREPGAGDARREYELLGGPAAVEDAWEAPERLLEALEGFRGLIVDALFGVGLTRPLEAPFTTVIAAANAAPGLRLAVDVPSGLDSDTGEARPLCIQAHVTATMAAPKRGLAAHPTAAGRVIEVDIGLPAALHRPYLLDSGI